MILLEEITMSKEEPKPWRGARVIEFLEGASHRENL